MSLWQRIFAERRAVVLPLALFLGANLAVLLLGVLPLRQSVVRAQNDATEARNGLAAAMVQQRQARTARTSTDNAGVELGTFYDEVLPASVRESDNLMYRLSTMAEAAGVQLRTGVGDWDEVRESNLMRVVNQAVLLGQYENVLRFLYAVEVAPEFIIIEKVELAQSSAQETGGVLELNLSVATYFIRDPDASGLSAGSGGGH